MQSVAYVITRKAAVLGDAHCQAGDGLRVLGRLQSWDALLGKCKVTKGLCALAQRQEGQAACPHCRLGHCQHHLLRLHHTPTYPVTDI